jgi:hypothetical protein
MDNYKLFEHHYDENIIKLQVKNMFMDMLNNENMFENIGNIFNKCSNEFLNKQEIYDCFNEYFTEQNFFVIENYQEIFNMSNDIIMITNHIKNKSLATNYINNLISLLFLNEEIINNLDKEIFLHFKVYCEEKPLFKTHFPNAHKFIHCCSNNYTVNQILTTDFNEIYSNNKFRFIDDIIIIFESINKRNDKSSDKSNDKSSDKQLISFDD